MQKVPPEDRFSWYVAATDSAGILAAAAGATSDDRLRRELIKAWRAINRATTTDRAIVGIPSDNEIPQRAAVSDLHYDATTHRSVAKSLGTAADVSALLGGASRVLMAARLADAQDHLRIKALVIQAVELAAQITRTIAAQRAATGAQRRAAEATHRAVTAAGAAGRLNGGWRFTKSGAEVLDSARGADVEPVVPDQPRSASPEPGMEPNESGR